MVCRILFNYQLLLDEPYVNSGFLVRIRDYHKLCLMPRLLENLVFVSATDVQWSEIIQNIFHELQAQINFETWPGASHDKCTLIYFLSSGYNYMLTCDIPLTIRFIATTMKCIIQRNFLNFPTVFFVKNSSIYLNPHVAMKCFPMSSADIFLHWICVEVTQFLAEYHIFYLRSLFICIPYTVRL